MSKHAPASLAQTLRQLRDADQPFPPAALHHFSRLEGGDLAHFEAAWPEASVERRRSVIADLSELAELNFELNFDPVFRVALEDDDAEVRAAAVRGLWEAEEPNLVAPFVDLLQHDPAAPVRSAAATALGKFVYLGEIDEVPRPLLRRVEETLLAVTRGGDEVEVRRHALEALGYSSRPEVPALIETAHAAEDDRWRVSALFAMGRSSDAERWGEMVLAALDSREADLRFEAVRATGELQLAEAVSSLKTCLEEEDANLAQAAVWSLSQIGGPEARRLISERLEQTEDEDEQEFLEEALENLDFTDDVARFELMDVSGEVDDDDDDDLEDDE